MHYVCRTVRSSDVERNARDINKAVSEEGSRKEATRLPSWTKRAKVKKQHNVDGKKEGRGWG